MADFAGHIQKKRGIHSESPLNSRAEHERILREFPWSFLGPFRAVPLRFRDRRQLCGAPQAHPRWRYCRPYYLRQTGSRQEKALEMTKEIRAKYAHAPLVN